MANIRAEIEQRLRIAEEDGDYVDAEAYSAWLALDAAPEVVVGETGMVFAGPRSYGTTVRLVATSGGG